MTITTAHDAALEARRKTSSSPRSLYLGANVANSGGTLPYSWTKSPTAATDPHDPELWLRIARTLERGGFDALFLGDVPHPVGRPDTTLSKLEPTTLLARLAGQTRRLGFVTTLSSSLNDPGEIARKLHTLQQLSGGRFAANIVTTSQREAYQNFGIDVTPDRSVRYARASVFADALVEHYDRLSVQGGEAGLPTHPLALMQAGGTEQGVDLAARLADAVYGSASTLQYSAGLRQRLRERVVAHGREPDAVRFIPGINVTLGRTTAEAEAQFDRYTGDLDSDTATAQLASLLGVSLDGLSPDDRIPDELLEEALSGSQADAWSIAHRRSFLSLVRELDEPLRRVVRRVDLNGTGHFTFVGSPDELAERLLGWYHAEAADGFIVRPQTVPEDLELFVDEVVPVLRAAGVLREDCP